MTDSTTDGMVTKEEHGARMYFEVAKQWGIFAAMVVFFMWVGYTRDVALDARVTKAEDFQRTTLTGLITSSTLALNDVAKQHDVLVRSLDDNTRELKEVSGQMQRLVPVVVPTAPAPK